VPETRAHRREHPPGGDRLTVDAVWMRIRKEAGEIVQREPELARFVEAAVLRHNTLDAALFHRVAGRLDSPEIPAAMIRDAYWRALDRAPTLADDFRADLIATFDRDPATGRLIEPLLYYKGFHAIQACRLAHWLWHAGKRDFAYYLQSRVSAAFQCDIHPAARIGRGLFLDHATGLVIGETAVVEDDVSMLHGVTLGGTGKESGDRHPKIRQGVLIGAGAKILGNIEVGPCSRVAAGSVVLSAVPPNVTVAGVPAKAIGKAGCAEPSRTMDQLLTDAGLP
jgi:serine O-acetyltransferase